MEIVERCPACGGGDRRAVTARGLDFAGEVVQACRGCGLYYLSPRMDAAERAAYYEAAYSRRYRGGEHPDERALARRDRVARYRFDLLRALGVLAPGRSLFEVGCGAGNFLLPCRELGMEVSGVDPSRGYAEAARAGGLAVEVGRFPEVRGPRERYDVATMFHVLEHLGDPVAALAAVRALLVPEGRLVVEVPDLARAFSLRWSERYFHRPHLLDFTASTLEFLLARCGFSPVVRDYARSQPGRRHHLLVVARPNGAAAPAPPARGEMDRLLRRVRRRLFLAALAGPPWRRLRAMLGRRPLRASVT